MAEVVKREVAEVKGEVAKVEGEVAEVKAKMDELLGLLRSKGVARTAEAKLLAEVEHGVQWRFAKASPRLCVQYAADCGVCKKEHDKRKRDGVRRAIVRVVVCTRHVPKRVHPMHLRLVRTSL